MYTLQGKTRYTPHVCFPHLFMHAQCKLPTGSPRTWQHFASHQQRWTDPTAPEKKDSQHNPQLGWVIRRSITQFPSQHRHWSSNESQISVDSRPLGLPGPYHRYAIGTFNTCSRGLTHQSLTNISRGYNLVGAGLPTPLPNLPNQRSYTFHLMAPPSPRLSIQPLPTEIRREQPINLMSGASPLNFYCSLSSKHSVS
jgi:hypothetical protein